MPGFIIKISAKNVRPPFRRALPPNPHQLLCRRTPMGINFRPQTLANYIPRLSSPPPDSRAGSYINTAKGRPLHNSFTPWPARPWLTNGTLFNMLKMYQIQMRLHQGLCPGPHWGELTSLPQIASRRGSEISSPPSTRRLVSTFGELDPLTIPYYQFSGSATGNASHFYRAMLCVSAVLARPLSVTHP